MKSLLGVSVLCAILAINHAACKFTYLYSNFARVKSKTEKIQALEEQLNTWSSYFIILPILLLLYYYITNNFNGIPTVVKTFAEKNN